MLAEIIAISLDILRCSERVCLEMLTFELLKTFRGTFSKSLQLLRHFFFGLVALGTRGEIRIYG